MVANYIQGEGKDLRPTESRISIKMCHIPHWWYWTDKTNIWSNLAGCYQDYLMAESTDGLYWIGQPLLKVFVRRQHMEECLWFERHLPRDLYLNDVQIVAELRDKRKAHYTESKWEKSWHFRRLGITFSWTRRLLLVWGSSMSDQGNTRLKRSLSESSNEEL